MANKDFYDRIADALEVIAGDDSHVDDIDKNMDYYKRIAEALQDIAENGGSGSGSGSGSGGVLIVSAPLASASGIVGLDHTWQEIYDAYTSGISVVGRAYINETEYIMRSLYNIGRMTINTQLMYFVTFDFAFDNSSTFICASPSDLPYRGD